MAAGGRPLRSTLNEKKKAMIHERVIEIITEIQTKVWDSLTPVKIVSSYNLGTGDAPVSGIRVANVIDGYFSFPGFTRIFSNSVVQKAVARGISERVFGYYAGGHPALGKDGIYQVAEDKVVFDTDVAQDEIDLEIGFLMAPEAIPRPIAQPDSIGTTGGEPPSHVLPDPGSNLEPQPPAGMQPGLKPTEQGLRKWVAIQFSADRDKLFESWQAIANLADMAGKVYVSIEANADEGFDENKLRNAVFEPLQEADLIED